MAVTANANGADAGLKAVSSPASATTGTLPPRSNALQSRVSSVLSASYADLDIRDALSILDERGLQNTAATRRNLRLDVQQQIVECNGEIVQDFGKVAEQLKRIGAALDDLNSSCAAMRQHIDAAKRETAPLIEEAKSIFHDAEQVNTKRALLEAFKAHFVVSGAELTTLTSTAEPVNDDFFRVLTRVKKIHADSQVLLGFENQRIGLETLEQSSRQLNSAYKKLFRWAQREFKGLDLESPQINSNLRRALRVLAERPSMFQNTLDIFAESREHVLSNHFYASLTGSPIDHDHPVLGKAIELSAHDPQRYIGDMLAWAHSAAVSEREAMEQLFVTEADEITKSIQAGIESEPWARETATDEVDAAAVQPIAFDGRAALRTLIDRSLTGVMRQLKQRTEQVLQSQDDAVLAYRIANLITFYQQIFTNVVGGDAALLMDFLVPLSESAMRRFKSINRDVVASITESDTTVASTDNLSAPGFLLDALETINQLAKSFDATVSPTADRASRADAFSDVISEALDPFTSGCENMAAQLPPVERHIFALNYLSVAREALRVWPFASSRLDAFAAQASEAETQLTAEATSWLVEESGIAEIINHVNSPNDLAVYYDSPRPLATAAQRLDAFLPSAAEEARGTLLNGLNERHVARRIIERAAEEFCERFERLEDMLLQADEMREKVLRGEHEDAAFEDADHTWLRDVLPRTGAEIRVLLS